MKITTEKAFRDSDRAIRILGDLKHSIYQVKTAGGISEKERLEALLGLHTQAQQILKNMVDSIGEAIYEYDKNNVVSKLDNNCSSCSFETDGQKEEYSSIKDSIHHLSENV